LAGIVREFRKGRIVSIQRKTQLLAIAGTLFCVNAVQAGILTGPTTNPSNGNKYYLLTQNTWSGSEAEAVGLGGHLATINNAAENSWVTSTFSNFQNVPRALWIGLNDVSVEGRFVWVSGQPVAYTNWGPDEPNDYLDIEDWAHIFPSNDTAERYPKWNDAPNQTNAFGYVFHGVVEINAVPEPSTLLLATLALAAVGRLMRCGRRRDSKRARALRPSSGQAAGFSSLINCR
jgi:hypothetical protein